jgi:hypothetical protein
MTALSLPRRAALLLLLTAPLLWAAAPPPPRHRPEKLTRILALEARGPRGLASWTATCGILTGACGGGPPSPPAASPTPFSCPLSWTS